MHTGTDETYIALNGARPVPVSGWAPYSGKPGVHHPGCEVEDVDALRARIAAAGIEEETIPVNHPHRMRVCFNHAKGNDWAFMQYFTDDMSLRNDYDLPE